MQKWYRFNNNNGNYDYNQAYDTDCGDDYEKEDSDGDDNDQGDDNGDNNDTMTATMMTMMTPMMRIMMIMVTVIWDAGFEYSRWTGFEFRFSQLMFFLVKLKSNFPHFLNSQKVCLLPVGFII